MTSTGSPWQPSSRALKKIIRRTQAAGRLALHHFGEVAVQYKPDGTPVTEIDRHLEKMLVAQLRALYPAQPVLAEETACEKVDPDQAIWVIDPLDGTTPYSQGLPGWGIAIGLLDRGQPAFGLFYMPLLDDLTCTMPWPATHGRAARSRQGVRREWDSNSLLAVGTTAHREFHLAVPRTRAIGSIGAHLVYTARGVATAALIPRAYLWDLIPGAAILKRAGGELAYLSGRRLDYTELLDGRPTREPLLAGHPAVLAGLRPKIRKLSPV